VTLYWGELAKDYQAMQTSCCVFVKTAEKDGTFGIQIAHVSPYANSIHIVCLAAEGREWNPINFAYAGLEGNTSLIVDYRSRYEIIPARKRRRVGYMHHMTHHLSLYHPGERVFCATNVVNPTREKTLRKIRLDV